MTKIQGKNIKNQIFTILTLLRQSVYRVVGPNSTAWRMGNTAPKTRRNGGEALATMCRFDRHGNETPDFSHRQCVLNSLANWQL